MPHSVDPHRPALVLLLVLACAWLLPAPAWGHASLESSSPAIDEVVDAPPDALTLEFGGPVTVQESDLRLLQDDGEERPVAGVSTSGATTVAVDLPELERGTHTLAWLVYTDHGDALRGLVPFHVGERTGGDADVLRARLVSDAEEEQRDDRRAAILRIGVPALLLSLVVLALMVARPAWRIPASIALILVVVLAIGLLQRTGDDDPPRVGTTASTVLSGGETLRLRVDPAAVGANDLVVELDGEPEDGAAIEELELRATPADPELGAMRVAFERADGGRFVLDGQTFPVAGTWSLALTATRSSGSGQQVAIDVPISE